MLRPILLLLAALAAACGDTPTTQGDARGGAPEYEAAFVTVIEKGGHGPRLCLGAIATSLPPQCGGPPLRNWSWDLVDNEESAAGTRWAGVSLRGTYDGETFTVVSVVDKVRDPGRPREHDFSAACPEPERADPAATVDGWQGFDDAAVAGVWMSRDKPAINIVVRPGHAARVRDAIRTDYRGPLCVVERDQRARQELHAIQQRLTQRLHGELLSAATDEVRGIVEVVVIVATPELQAELDREFGPGVVELEGRLRPLSRSRPPGDGGG